MASDPRLTGWTVGESRVTANIVAADVRHADMIVDGVRHAIEDCPAFAGQQLTDARHYLRVAGEALSRALELAAAVRDAKQPTPIDPRTGEFAPW